MNIFKKILLSLSLCATSMIHGEFLYSARDIGTFFTDKSEARSLNEDGWIAGKYFQGEEVSDFLWTPESGLEVISNEVDKEIFPKLNNLGKVMGLIFKPGSWFSSARIQSYTLNRENGFKLGQSDSRDNGVTIFMNNSFIIVCDHINVFESTNSWIVDKNQTVKIGESFLKMRFYPTAMNNTSQVLITAISPGVFNTSFLATYMLGIYDVATGEWNEIADDKLYHGCGINDHNLVIARDKSGYEGFYGSKDLGMISLGDFIPVALNNQGDIVGKKGKEVLLRKSDGAIIDLNKEADLKSLGIDRIIDVWALNTLGQILVTAQISGKSHALLLEPTNTSL